VHSGYAGGRALREGSKRECQESPAGALCLVVVPSNDPGQLLTYARRQLGRLIYELPDVFLQGVGHRHRVRQAHPGSLAVDRGAGRRNRHEQLRPRLRSPVGRPRPRYMSPEAPALSCRTSHISIVRVMQINATSRSCLFCDNPCLPPAEQSSLGSEPYDVRLCHLGQSPVTALASADL